MRWLLAGACLMSFFGPGGLTGKSEQGLDPQLMQALLSQFPGLEGLRNQGQQQQPKSLGSLGYQWPGAQLYSGQGQNSFSLSPFEGAGGSSPESITAGLASGTFGRSASISPLGTPSQPQQSSLLSLPSLQLPMAQVASQQGGISGGDGGDMMGMGAGSGGGEDGGFSIGAGDVLGAGQKALDIFGGDTQGQQTDTPGFAQKDLSTLGGSFLQSNPQGAMPGANTPALPGIGEFAGGTSLPEMPVLPGVGELVPFDGGGLPGVGEPIPSGSMNAPGGSARFALGPEGAPQGDLLGGGISTLQGLLSLYGGAQSGDIGQLLSGGAGTLGGLGQLSPEMMGQISQSLGLGQGGLGLAAGGLGGLAGGYGLYQGIEQGDPLQALMGAAGLYSGAAPIVNSAFGTTLPGLTDIVTQIINAVSGGTSAGVAGGAGVGAGAAGASAGASSVLGAAAPIIAALVAYFGNQEEMNARNSGWMNNPMKGALYSNSTQAVGGVNNLLAQLGGGTGDLSGKDTYELGQGLSAGLNSLMPYYATTQGGRGAIKASDTVTGGTGGSQSEKYTGDGASPEQYTQNFTQANQGIARLVNELMGRGVTYEQLGQLPVSGDWAGMSLDAGNRPEDMLRNSPNLARYQTEGSGFFGARGMNPIDSYTSGGGEGGDWSQAVTKTQDQQVQELLQSVLGASMEGPADVTKASGLMTNMYGGPLWAALARSGAGGDPGLMSLINQKFDPWVSLREPAATAPQSDFWGGLGDQYAKRTDPVTQQLMQFQQQLGQLTQQTPQILQGLQASTQGAQLPPEMAMSGGGGQSPSGGGIDLEALLRQLGYLR